MMVVSVIIPIYKVETYIRRCLGSVMTQECNGYHIECILVDDCSPDRSMEIVNEMIDEYQGKNISFLLLRHESNKGLSAARNTGIKAATGDYLFFMDSDDYILENTLKNLISHLLAYPFVDVVMGISLRVESNELTNSLIMDNNMYPVLLDDKRQMWELLLNRKLDHHAWNKLVSRSLVLKHHLMFEESIIFEDKFWTYRLVSCISSILIIPKQTYIYENNPFSIIHTPSKRSNQLLSSFALICETILNHPPVIDSKKCLFVEHHIFVQHWMLVALDYARQYGVEWDTKKRLDSVRRRLFGRALCRCRLILAFYSLTLFPPLTFFLEYRFYRSNLYCLEKFAYLMAKCGDKIRFYIN